MYTNVFKNATNLIILCIKYMNVLFCLYLIHIFKNGNVLENECICICMYMYMYMYLYIYIYIYLSIYLYIYI